MNSEMGYVQDFLEFFKHIVWSVYGVLDAPGGAGDFLRYLLGVATALCGLSLIVACLGLFSPRVAGYLRALRAAAQSGYDWHDPLVERYTLNKNLLERHFRGGTDGVKAQFMGFPDVMQVYDARDHGIGYSAGHLQSFFERMPPVFRETIRYINFPDSWDAESLGLSDELHNPYANGIFVKSSQTIHIHPLMRARYSDDVEQTIYHEAMHSYEYVYGTVAANTEYYGYLRSMDGDALPSDISKNPRYFDEDEFVAEAYSLYKVKPDLLYARTPTTYGAMRQLDFEINSRSAH